MNEILDIATEPQPMAALIEATREMVASVMAGMRSGMSDRLLRQEVAAALLAQCNENPSLASEDFAAVIAVLTTELATACLINEKT